MKGGPPPTNPVRPHDDRNRDDSFGLRATIDFAPIGLAQFDALGRFLLVNDRLCEILGQTRSAVLARSFQELTFPEDLPHCLELTARLAAGEIPGYCVDKRFVRADGSAVWARITVSAVRRQDGDVAFFIGAAEDISEQVAAGQALRSAEERLRTALDASMIGTFRFDVRRNALDWADGMERVFGTAQNITLEQFFEAIHPDDRTHVLKSYTTSVTEGSDFEEEFRVIWPDGSIHWLHDRGRMVLGTDGRPHYILGAITDVSSHKRMEEDVREREARYRRALNVENIGVIFFDHQHCITGINDAFSRMSGYTNTEIAGKVLWRDLIPAHDRQLAEARQAEFDAAGRTTPSELEFIRSDGRRWWGLVTATRVSATEGVKYVLDITARKEAEREREEVLRREQAARRDAERAIALRQQVLGFVAHDLRNPLHTIVMSTSSLLEFSLPEEQRSRLLDLIARSAWGMDRLIGDLLDLSRIEAGTFAVQLAPTAIPQILHEVADNFHQPAQSRGVALVSEVPPDVPLVHADHQRLVQALSNLIANALKFTPPGGRVLLAARPARAHVDIVIRDTGCGIQPENLERVFDRFWQADRTAGGAGLGLAIVKGIVESHGGQIDVDSVPGRGTTVSLRLPHAPSGHPREAKRESVTTLDAARQ